MIIKQLLTALKKEFKLLLRSKTSTLTLLFGPLVLIILLGVVFTTAGSSTFTIGVVANEELSVFKQALSESFILVDYNNKENCKQAVISQEISGCVVLTPGDPPKATIMVDPSELDVMYAMLDKISGSLESKSSSIRESIASKLLNLITKTNFKLEKDIEQLSSTSQKLSDIKISISEITNKLPETSVDTTLIPTNDVKRVIDSAIDTRDQYQEIAEQLIIDYESFVKKYVSDEDPQTTYLEAIDDTYKKLDDIKDQILPDEKEVINSLISNLDELSEEVNLSSSTADQLSTQAQQILSELSLVQNDILFVISSLESTKESLSGLGINDEDITTPIKTQVEPVESQGSAFLYMFPYFIVLLIMFTSILLASNIVIRERESQAYFRNFVTPTKDWVFVIATFLATTLIVTLQLTIIFLFIKLFNFVSIKGSLLTTITSLLTTTAFFTLFGMLLGYSFKHRETVMLASIGFSSILMFLSPLTFPIATLSEKIQLLVRVNPFVITSDMFRASNIFGLGFEVISIRTAIIILYCIMLFAIIMIMQRVARIRRFESKASDQISKFLGEEDIPEGKELLIEGRSIASKQELLAVLKVLSDEQYEKYANITSNKIADWIADVYKDEKLADALRNKSRKGAIDALRKKLK